MRTAFGRDVRDLAGASPPPPGTRCSATGARASPLPPARGAPEKTALPLLVVPSMINRWYVLDLRRVELLRGAGRRRVDTFLLDWGVPATRTGTSPGRRSSIASPMVRRVQRITGAPKVGIPGYCMGARRSRPSTARSTWQRGGVGQPSRADRLPQGRHPAHPVRPEWFDADAVADAGNVSPKQMQSGFQAMRPTLDLSKMINLLDRAKGGKPVLDGFYAMETWPDNIPFPPRPTARTSPSSTRRTSW